jgi:hypothetical protein
MAYMLDDTEPTDGEAFGPRTSLMLDYLAYTVQNPGKRPLWWWLIISPGEGYGKDSFAKLVEALVGDWNFRRVNPKEVGEGRNLFVQDVRFGVMNEAFISPERFNDLKTLITEKVVGVRPLYQDWYEVEHNFTAFVFSNNVNAMPLDDSNTRFYVVVNERPRRDSEEFKPYYAAIEDPAVVQTMFNFLACRDVSGFNPYRLSPDDCGDLNEVISSVGGSAAATIKVMIENRDVPFDRELVTVRGVMAELTKDPETARFARDLAEKRIGSILTAVVGKPERKRVAHPKTGVETMERIYVLCDAATATAIEAHPDCRAERGRLIYGDRYAGALAPSSMDAKNAVRKVRAIGASGRDRF